MKNENRKLGIYLREINVKYGILRICVYSIFLIILTLLLENLISNFSSNINYWDLNISIVLVFIMIVLIFSIGQKKYKILNSTYVYKFDLIIHVILIYSTLLLLIKIAKLCFKKQINIYLLIFDISLLLFSIGTSIFRNLIINNKGKNKYSTISFDDLLKKDVSELDFPVFLHDKEADYDLLNRKLLVEKMANLIFSYNLKETYTIALKGAWGSGKSTIIKQLKNRIAEENEKEKNSKSIRIIDKFNPWLYNDQRALITAFIKELTNDLYESTFNSVIKEVYKSITEILPNSKFLGHVGSLFQTNINDFKNYINNYLEIKNIYLLIVIDNIERCNGENIKLLIDTIHNAFNFDRTIYLISYDENALKNIFKNEISYDYSYLEKIVQHEFYVPIIDNQTMQNIIKRSIKQFVLLANSKNNRKCLLDDIDSLVSIIMDFVKDLRSLKRILNSVLSQINFIIDSFESLYINDLILLEVLHFYNYNLWFEIYLNKNFFMTYDNHYANEVKRLLPNEYNKMAKLYFESFLPNKEKYYRILSELFPNVKLYLDNSKSKKECIFMKHAMPFNNENDEYKKSIVNTRIFNGRYFDFYFLNKNNLYCEAIDIIKNKIFIKKFSINNFKDLFNENEERRKLIIELIKTHIDYIETYSSNFIVIMYFLINNYDTYCIGIENIKNEIISLLIIYINKLISENDIYYYKKIILYLFKNGIKNINILYNVFKTLKKTLVFENKYFLFFDKKIKKIYNTFDIMSLYNLNNYRYHNIFEFTEFNDNIKVDTSDFSKLLSSNSICFILFFIDMIEINNEEDGLFCYYFDYFGKNHVKKVLVNLLKYNDFSNAIKWLENIVEISKIDHTKISELINFLKSWHENCIAPLLNNEISCYRNENLIDIEKLAHDFIGTLNEIKPFLIKTQKHEYEIFDF